VFALRLAMSWAAKRESSAIWTAATGEQKNL
jgi:hypothetical protein